MFKMNEIVLKDWNLIMGYDYIIVGAGSFVRKSISDKGIYSGNPAILKIKSKKVNKLLKNRK